MLMLLKILCLCFFFTIPTVADGIDYTFEQWVLKDAEKYVSDLISIHKSLSDSDLQRSAARIAELKKTNDWGAIALELERIAAKKDALFSSWLDLAEAYAHKSMESNENWDARRKSSSAAIKAYTLASNDTEKAQALIVYAQTLYDWSDERTKILSLLSSRDDLKTVKSDPRFATFLAFKYVDYTLFTEKNPAEVRFSFNGELAEQNIADFIESSPKVDAKIKVSGRNIIVKGLNFETAYNFTLKAGIKGKFGETLKEPIQVGVKVADQSVRLAFKAQQYILQRTEKLSLPLEAVNIDKIKVSIFRLADHVLAGNMTRPYDSTFLKQLNSYDFKHIKNSEGHKLFEGEMTLGGERNTTRIVGIPLDEAVKNQKPGVYIVYVEDKSNIRENTSIAQWVIITDMGVTTFSGSDGLHVDVRKLSDAKSYKGAKVSLISHNQSVLSTQQTDDNGRVHFNKELLLGKDGDRPLMITCHGEGNDFTLIDLTKSPLDLTDLSIAGRTAKDGEDLYIYTDRGVYRPGESIHFQALLRNEKLQGVSNASLTFKLNRPDGVTFKIDSVQGNDVGMFEHHFALLESSPTGRWVIQGFADPKDNTPLFETTVSVEDFTPARILVKTETKEKSLSPEKTLEATVKAEYLFGGKAGDLAAEAVVLFSKDPAPFEGYKNFTFGNSLEDYTPQRLEVGLSALDDKGEAIVSIDGKSIQDASTPLLAQLRVNIFDRGGKPQLGTAKFQAFTKPVYIGISSGSERVDGDAETASFEVIAVSREGQPQPLPQCKWTLYKEKVDYTWYQMGNKWRYNVIRSADTIEDGTLSLSDKNPTSLSVKVPDWGDYVLEIQDPKSGVISKVRFTKGWGRGDRVDVPDILKIRLDKESYKIGEEVNIHIESPFSGEALLTLANTSGVIQQQLFKLEKGQTSYKTKATEDFGTGVYVLMNGYRPLSGDGKDSQLPVRTIGLAWCPMDKSERVLNLNITTDPFSKPRTSFDVNVNIDNAGKSPVYLTLAAVDEGILLLTDYKNPDPLTHFYGKKEFPLEIRDLYGYLVQDIPTETGAFHTGGDEGALARNLAALSKRSFKLISLYSGVVFLQDGKAKIPFQVPDFNGRIRIMGVAASNDKIGAAQTSITVKDPIVVETILPRFLAPKDKSQMILSLHNQTGKEEEITVKIKAEGAIHAEKDTLNIKLAKDSEQVFMIPLNAEKSGTGTVSLSVKGSGEMQTYTHDLTVREGIPFKTKSEAALLEQGKPLEISGKDLAGMIEESGKMALSFGKTPWSSKKAAYHLAEYPYSCIEQTVSKGFGLLYLKESEGAKSEDALNTIISSIAQNQNISGGFDFWPGMESAQSEKIFLSAYVYDFLSQVKKSGLIVPSFTFDNLENFLKSTMSHLYDKTNKEIVRAASYALYTLVKNNALEPGTIRYFYDTFFEAAETSFSQSCIIYALSTFSDDARLRNALEKVNTATSKNLVDMLATYKIMDEASLNHETIKEAFAKARPALLNQIRQKVNGESVFSTLERAWMVRGTTPSAEELAINIDGKKVTEKAPIFREFLATDINHTFENLSPTPLWVTKIMTGQMKDNNPISQGVKITRKLFDLTGNEIKENAFSQGQQIICVIEGTIEGTAERNMLLVDLLPAGVQLDALPKLVWLGELTPPTFTHMRDDRFVASFTVDEKINTFKIAYMMRAITLGDYLYPGTFVEDMVDARIFAQNAASRCSVNERKAQEEKKITSSTHVQSHAA